jgi:hypothetical protein
MGAVIVVVAFVVATIAGPGVVSEASKRQVQDVVAVAHSGEGAAE